MQSYSQLSVSSIKSEARMQLSGKWREVILLHIVPVLITIILTGGIYGFDILSVPRLINAESEENGLLNFMVTFVTIGISFTLLDMIRSSDFRISPLKDSFQVFSKMFFVPIFIIQVLQVLFISLWSLLFLIPGMIKTFSYSQAFFIYKDKRERDEYPSSLECITISRELMDGHKMELFVLYLSFIGWFLLEALTLGFASIWVRPYLNTSLVVFYDNLVAGDTLDSPNVIIEEEEEDGFGEY